MLVFREGIPFSMGNPVVPLMLQSKPVDPKELVLAFLGGVGCFAALVGWEWQQGKIDVGSFAGWKFNIQKMEKLRFVLFFLYCKSSEKVWTCVDYFVRLGCFV